MKNRFLPIIVLVAVVLAAGFFVFMEFKKQGNLNRTASDFWKNNELKDTFKNVSEDSNNRADINDWSDMVSFYGQNGNFVATSTILDSLLGQKDDNQNLTKLFSLLIAKEMISNMESGRATGSNMMIDSTQILESAKQYMPDIEEIWKTEFVSESVLKISNDNSNEAIINYIKSGASIMSLYFKETQDNPNYLSEIINKNEREKIQIQIGNFDKAIKDFKGLAVPSSFSGLHKEQINILILQKKMLEDIYNAPQDPVRAYIVTAMMEDVFKQHRSLINEINKKLMSMEIQQ